jgi:hypothetical protein
MLLVELCGTHYLGNPQLASPIGITNTGAALNISSSYRKGAFCKDSETSFLPPPGPVSPTPRWLPPSARPPKGLTAEITPHPSLATRLATRLGAGASPSILGSPFQMSESITDPSKRDPWGSLENNCHIITILEVFHQPLRWLKCPGVD